MQCDVVSGNRGGEADSFLRWPRPEFSRFTGYHMHLGTQQKTILFLPAIKLEPSGTDDASESVVEFGIT